MFTAHRFLLAVVCTLLGTVALPASATTTAQIELVNEGSPQDTVNQLTIDGDTRYNVDVGPYTLSINGQNTPALSVDFLDVSNVGDTWTAYTTPVDSSHLGTTYHPSYGQEYEEDAYLLEQILHPGSDRVGLQVAAWDVIAYGITNSSYKYLIGDNSYIDAALANYDKINLTGFEIISDTVAGQEEEFLVTTPEPRSILLLLSGLLTCGLSYSLKRIGVRQAN